MRGLPGGWQEELLKRRKANTYKERRRDGRTVHTKASKTAITVASIALIFNIMAIAMPHWRSSWVALIGYGSRRHWGLLAVQGRKMTMHHTMFDNNCKWYGHLLLGNSCLSPICKWYLLKCNVYFDLCLYSYSAAFVIILALVIHLLCLYWTCLLSGRTLRWAATWWPVAAVLHIGGAIFWILMTEGIFDTLDEESWYPIPTPGAAFFLACIGGVGHLVNCWLAFGLTKTWPEVDPDDVSQFLSESEGEGSEDEDLKEQMQAEMPEEPGPMAWPAPAAPVAAPVAAPMAAPVPAPVAAPVGPPAERVWYYKDAEGGEQGPFAASAMLGWLAQGMFTTDLQVRGEGQKDYVPLGDGSCIRP